MLRLLLRAIFGTKITVFDWYSNCILFLFLSILPTTANAQPAIGWQWAAAGQCTAADRASGVAAGKHKEVLVCGTFNNLLTLGSITIGSPLQNSFLCKYDSAGRVLSAQVLGSNGESGATSVGVDSAGNTYVAGRFVGTFGIGANTFVGSAMYAADGYLAKYDPQGNLLWAQHLRGNPFSSRSNVLVNDLAVDSRGNVTLAGSFEFQLTIGSDVLTSSGSGYSTTFVVQFTPQGSVRWTLTDAGGATSSASGVKLDSVGNVYVVGQFITGARFGSQGVVINSSYSALYLLRVDPNGNATWIRQSRFAAGGQHVRGTALALDQSANIYVTGSFAGAAAFDTITVNSSAANAEEVYVAKYTSAGTLRWVRQAGSPGNDAGRKIEVDQTGRCHVLGISRGALTIGTQLVPANDSASVFVARYDSTGTFESVVVDAGLHPVQAIDLAVNAMGEGTVVGYYTNGAQFGATVLPYTGGRDDLFVARFGLGGSTALPEDTPATTSGSLAVYPNPSSSGSIHIILPLTVVSDAHTHQVQLTDLSGKVVKVYAHAYKMQAGRELIVPVADLRTGVYVLRLISTNQTWTKRITVIN